MKKILESLIYLLKLNENIRFQCKKMELLNSFRHNTKKEISNSKRERKIIVSLTTYNKRIYDVYLTIESLFNQTVKADKIVLWLAEDEFDFENIPLTLKQQMERGLEINFVKDIKSYKKIIPALKKYSEDFIITIDDDIFYANDMIENLFRTYKKEPESIICYRAHGIRISKNHLKPYKKWKHEVNKNFEGQLFLTSGGGTLFFPGSFDEEVFNEKIFMKDCPNADDIWINAMLIKNKKRIKMVDDLRRWKEVVVINPQIQDIGLYKNNYKKNENDIQLDKVFKRYKLIEKLREVTDEN